MNRRNLSEAIRFGLKHDPWAPVVLIMGMVVWAVIWVAFDGHSPEGRAVVNGASEAVSAVPASIPNAREE